MPRPTRPIARMAARAKRIEFSDKNQVPTITDPKLLEIGDRIAKRFYLAAEKVAANSMDPTTYPIGRDPLALLFRPRFLALHPEVKEVAQKNVRNLLKNKNRRRKLYGRFAKIDIASRKSIEAQAKAIRLPKLRASESEANSILASHTWETSLGARGLRPQETTDRLELRIHRVKCHKETSWEPGKDEIYLGGSTIDETGDVKKVPKFKVKSFHTGQQKVYSPPKRFTRFNLREGKCWPKHYYVTMVLAEADWGGFDAFLNKLVDKLEEYVVAELGALIGGAIGSIGGLVGAALGALIGLLVGWIVGKIFDWLKSLWGDEIFKPATVSMSIPSFNARWPGNRTDSPNSWIKWWGHGGRYQLWYDWRLTT